MFAARIALLLLCLLAAALSDPACVIELECPECVPDNMPAVVSHRAANGSVRVAAGAELRLECAGGRFVLYPLTSALVAVCEAGRYRVALDRRLRHLLDLGCQENIFEDVLHQVDNCESPMQGRAYQVQEPDSRGVRHLATVCYDADRGIARALHASNARDDRLSLPPHADRKAPLSLLGNFNHMFDAATRRDAEKLYSDDVRLNRRLRELFKHDDYCFAEQTLTSAKLLGGRYFDDQNVRVTDFASNRVAAWRSVVGGNLRHLHGDVADRLQRGRGAAHLDVYAGTHGVLALSAEVFLKAGNRFPVPKYIWTVLHAPSQNKGVAIVLLNDPFVTVSEIREVVFCDSNCGAVSWLSRLKRNRNYERPVSGLVFCCTLQDFSKRVIEMPKIFNETVKYLN